MSDEDRYRHHAYNYGWQRAVLHRMDPREPMDPAGDWYVSNMADRAEDWHRKRLGMPAKRHTRPPMPTDSQTVRANWRQLMLRDLTAAERALAAELLDEHKRRLLAESPKAAAMLDSAVGNPFGNLAPEAPEILPP